MRRMRRFIGPAPIGAQGGALGCLKGELTVRGRRWSLPDPHKEALTARHAGATEIVASAVAMG
jgi:hypothetical protein